MGKLRDGVVGVKTFVEDVGAEMKKSTWPERDELIESTVLVLALILILAVVVGVFDTALVSFFKFIIPSGLI